MLPRSIRALAPIALVALVALASCKRVPPEAQPAAQSWLALIDGAKYAQSWTEAASPFRDKMTSPDWEGMVAKVRAPLGKVISRTVKGCVATTTLPGVPDGEYVLCQFDTAFEHRAAAVETVTPMKDTDGRWRVSGYFIK